MQEIGQQYSYMKLPVVSKIVGVIVANKAVGVAVGMSLLVAVPTTLYISEKQKNTQEVAQRQTTEQVEQTEKSEVADTTDPVASTDTPQATSPTSNQSPTTSPTNNQSVTTNPTTSTTPSTSPTTSPTFTTPPAPAYPPVGYWDLDIVSVSPTSCGSDSNKCLLGQELTVTTKFTDRNTGRRITITNCVAYGTLSAGPVSLYPDPYHLYATATMPDNETCIARFTPTSYGLFGIWIEAQTSESPTQPNFANNTRYVWIR
jgi:hypothetical protein